MGLTGYPLMILVHGVLEPSNIPKLLLIKKNTNKKKINNKYKKHECWKGKLKKEGRVEERLTADRRLRKDKCIFPP